jgi:hypothetical protein
MRYKNTDAVAIKEEGATKMPNELKPKMVGNYHHNGNTRHGLYREHKDLFNLWQTMKTRCENPNRDNYERYGARGISVCDEWQEAKNFVEWALANGYQRGLQLDRIDNNKGYSPDNCRFVTAKENNRNIRNTKLLTINEETKSVAEWCEGTKISPYTVYWWIRERGRYYAEHRLADRLEQESKR